MITRLYYGIEGIDRYLEDMTDRLVGIIDKEDGAVNEKIQKALEQSTEYNVYYYEPRGLGDRRRKTNKGLADSHEWQKNTKKINKTYVRSLITSKVKWQHLFGGQRPHENLADVIEKKGMYNAPPRPFFKVTEVLIGVINGGTAETIANELKKIGF